MRKKTMNFTKTEFSRLPEADPGKRLCFYDSKLDGLELRITDTGVKSFSVYRWVNGKAVRVVLGRYNPDAIQSEDFDRNPLTVLANNPGLTIEQARMLAAAVISQLTLGNNPMEGRRASKEITLNELFRCYIDNYAVAHTKTWKTMEGSFDRYLAHWAKRPVSSIRKTEVQLLVNKIGKDHGHTTANRTLELLRATINKAKEWGLFEGDNPASGVTKFKLKVRERFLLEDELPRLIAAIEAEENEDIRDYVMLSLQLGARKSNILSMRWQDLDLDSAKWVIPDTKNNTSQTILLTDGELKILSRRHRDRKKRNETGNAFEFVFPGTGKSRHLEDPKKGWARILSAAKITNLHLHDLRRSLGSYMAMTGASLSVIGNALNHKDVTTTRRVYAHSAREAERTARMLAHKKMFDGKKTDNENKKSIDIQKGIEF